ncbi:hypothetical protein SDC9_12955 [bioreactor metagenome]|uniref:Uncharacterized protein n=1 Tax=bioreactor metagenome TaxID=1076179 RepID=A0A644TK29_9ZZZZ
MQPGGGSAPRDGSAHRHRWRGVARLRPEAVGAGLRGLDEEEQQDQPADERDEGDQQPPPRLVEVMQPPRPDGDHRHQDRQGEDRAQRAAIADPARIARAVHEAAGAEQHRIDDAQHDLAEKGEKDEPPVFRARGAPGKGGVFRQRRANGGLKIHRGLLADACIWPAKCVGINPSFRSAARAPGQGAGYWRGGARRSAPPSPPPAASSRGGRVRGRAAPRSRPRRGPKARRSG